MQVRSRNQLSSVGVDLYYMHAQRTHVPVVPNVRNDHEPEMVILFDYFERNASTHVQENLIRPYGVTWT